MRHVRTPKSAAPVLPAQVLQDAVHGLPTTTVQSTAYASHLAPAPCCAGPKAWSGGRQPGPDVRDFYPRIDRRTFRNNVYVQDLHRFARYFWKMAVCAVES